MTPHYTKSTNCEYRWRKWFESLTFNYGRCCYCGVHLISPWVTGKHVMALHTATREHMQPESRGGRWQGVWACLGCNQNKAALTVNEWRAALAVRYKTIPVFWWERRIPSILIDLAAIKTWDLLIALYRTV